MDPDYNSPLLYWWGYCNLSIQHVCSKFIVCKCNFLLVQDQNVFDSKKKMKVATADGLQQKLTSEQRKTIAVNQCLLYMYTNQVMGSRICTSFHKWHLGVLFFNDSSVMHLEMLYMYRSVTWITCSYRILPIIMAPLVWGTQYCLQRLKFA